MNGLESTAGVGSKPQGYEQIPSHENAEAPHNRNPSLMGEEKAFAEDELPYDEKRQKMKFSYMQSAVIIFQSTVGISWFTLHQPLAKVGLYLGLLITLMSGYITTYGLLLLDEVASLAERDYNRSDRIKNAEELCGMVQGKWMPTVKWVMMIASLAMMYASSISNVCMMGRVLILTTSRYHRRVLPRSSQRHQANHLPHHLHLPHHHHRARRHRVLHLPDLCTAGILGYTTQ